MATDTYESLLEKAKKELPDRAETSERFEIPLVKGHIQGNKTIVTNFSQICSTIMRDQDHLLKFLQRELATPASIDGPRLVLGRNLSSGLINAKVTRYCMEFVLCKECHKPDTKLVREERVLSLKCTACGAKHPVKAKF